MRTKTDVLIAARRLIEDEKYSYICNAIGDVCRFDNEHAYDLRKWIRALLGLQGDRDGTRTLDTWVYNEIGHDAYCAEKNIYDKLKETRLRWIDWMIDYWKDKENVICKMQHW